jgi:hypothetical protein
MLLGNAHRPTRHLAEQIERIFRPERPDKVDGLEPIGAFVEEKMESEVLLLQCGARPFSPRP